MRQKVTWIIPGILVTLLLGLLWAMPAFAADAGNIEFLDSDGDEINYLSLEGLGGDGGAIMIQVEDQDLNKPTKRSVTATTGDKDDDARTPPQSVDWSNLADANEDGNVNYQDFTAFVDDSGADSDYDDFDADEGETTADDPRRSDGLYQSFENSIDIAVRSIDLNTQGGTMSVETQPSEDDGQGGTVLATHLQFEIFEKDDISGRSATTEERTVMVTGLSGNDGEITASDLNGLITDINPPKPASYENRVADDTWTWLDILDTNRDGTVDGDDAGITVFDTGDTRRGASNDGTIASSVVKAVNSNEGAYELTLEYEITGDFSEGSDADDPADDVLAIVAVTAYGRAAVVAQPNAEPPVLPVTAIDVADPVNLTLNVAVPDIGSDKNRVRVSSDAFPTGINVILTESTARSGKFQAMLMICDSSTPATCAVGQDGTSDTGLTDGKGMIMLPANNQGDTVRVTYADANPSRSRSASIPLDVDSPSFSNLAPATGTSGREDEPTVSFDVQDTDSGISDDKDDGDSVWVLAGLYAIGGKNNLDQIIAYERDDLKLEEATNGYSASVSIEEGEADLDADEANAGSEYEVRWWAVSTDLAGNVGVSDSNSDTECAVPSTLNLGSIGDAARDLENAIRPIVKDDDGEVTDEGAGCDPFVVRVDAAAPELDETNTFTGTWLDGKTEKSGADGKRTSIVVAFNEALDCDSVSADDFEVDGSSPNGVTCNKNKVYLDVDELDPNDRPDIQVGNESLTDQAGNLIGDEDEITANDGIPAKLTVSVTGSAAGDRPITDEDLTIMIDSDERLAGNPNVMIYKLGTNHVVSLDTESHASPTGTVNQWSYTPVFGGTDDAGIYSVYITGNDLGSGSLKLKASAGTKGTEQKDADGEGTGEFRLALDAKGALLFEVDHEVTGPAWSPDIIDDGKTDKAGVFIRADFSAEGKEYGVSATCTKDGEDDKDIKADGTCDTGFTLSTTDVDSSGTVTLVSASFNDADVTDDVITRDNVLYVYRPGNLTNGEHEFTIEVMDAAGNEKEFTLEFEKVDRPAYKLELNPGPNLVSFPANPADGDINAVFGGEGNEDISQVLTFDNTTGLWSTATRGEDGMFMGDLTTVNGMNGYWVVADGIVDVSVVLEGEAGFAPPTHIQVQEGWNLIGVVDTDQSKAGTGIATSDYFANIDAEVVYGYDSLSGTLDRLSTAKAAVGEEQDMVETGKGYWVYANKAGIIVP